MDKPEQQKVKSGFRGNHGHVLHVHYNGLQQCFRLQFESMHRLFFFETELFDRTVFKNEYGLILGKLRAQDINSGWLQIDTVKYDFVIKGEDPRLILHYPDAAAPIVTFDINDELIMENLESADQKNLLRCLVFAFAWIVQLPASSF